MTSLFFMVSMLVGFPVTACITFVIIKMMTETSLKNSMHEYEPI